MSNFSNIPTGLKITSQIPLNSKEWVQNETTLAYLGVDDNLAFTYHEGLRVVCIEERKVYEWREVQSGEENTGLVPLDFTYPSMPPVFNIDYSNKKYNFFKRDYALLSDIKELISPDNSIDIVETNTQIQLTVEPTIANGSSTKIINGLQNIVTGTGTILDPYKIDGKLYQSGTGITITGDGTSLSPYVISINNTNGNIGWLHGDTKEIVCTERYVHANFDQYGLGINERVGWAIMNGATHGSITVPNDNGKVVIAYGADYTTLGAIGGSKNAVVVSHTHTYDRMVYTTTGDQSVPAGSTPYYTPDSSQTTSNASSGDSGVDKNMQPYVVRLRIMKL